MSAISFSRRKSVWSQRFNTRRHAKSYSVSVALTMILRVTHSPARCLHNRINDAVIRIPKSNIYRFGDSNKAKPIFENLDWTVNEGESWVVLGSGSGGQKTALLQVRTGFPPQLPYLSGTLIL